MKDLKPKLSSIIAMIIAFIFIVIASHVYGQGPPGAHNREVIQPKAKQEILEPPPKFEWKIFRPLPRQDIQFLIRMIKELQIAPNTQNAPDVKENYLIVPLYYKGIPECFVGVLAYSDANHPSSLYLLDNSNVYVLVWGWPCSPVEKIIERQQWEIGPRKVRS